jgi:tetratricopeptide (TPR) repeat protein
MEVLYANENLGILLKTKRRFAEAAQLFGGSLGPLQSFLTIDPRKTEYVEALINILGWYADSESALGNLDSATAARQRQIAFVDQRLAQARSDVALQAHLIPAHEGLGILLTARGQVDQGIAEYQLAIAQANSLLTVEPGNTEWRDMLANTQLQLASSLLAKGDAAQAQEQAAAGCRVADALRTRGLDVVRWRMLQTRCLSIRAQLALTTGSVPGALAFATQALASARSERSGDEIADRYSVAGAARLLGDVRERAGDPAGAAAAWSGGLAQLPANVAERPSEISDRVALLQRVGRQREAEQASSRLKSMGYRPLD